MELTHLSLFTGIGGLDLAAEWAGFKTVGQCEWADYPTKVLEKHWPDVARWRDIRTLTKESFYERTGLHTVDLISGGFPCQPFSVAGNQKGEDDERYLWPEMFRVIRELTPSWVIGENVPGIIKIAGRTVCENLESEKYAVTVFNFEAAAIGAPHRRDRVFFVANRNDGQCKPENETVQAGRNAACNGSCSVENAGRRRCEQQRVLSQQQRGAESICTGESGAQRSAPEMSKDVAYARYSELPGRNETTQGGEGKPCGKPSSCSCNVPDTESAERQSQWGETWRWRAEPRCSSWWATEPELGRVADGVADRVDRLKCLGNAVVPQQAYPIFKAIAEIERGPENA
jgi:DNA (cytosine-5)-methyltransferase 1